MANPVSSSEVMAYLKLSAPDINLYPVVDAVNVLLVQWFGDLADEETGDWPANYRLGGTMLAARVFRRRNSPAGVETFGELGPIYVQRNDPDIALMLGIGNYARPQVG